MERIYRDDIGEPFGRILGSLLGGLGGWGWFEGVWLAILTSFGSPAALGVGPEPLREQRSAPGKPGQARQTGRPHGSMDFIEEKLVFSLFFLLLSGFH